MNVAFFHRHRRVKLAVGVLLLAALAVFAVLVLADGEPPMTPAVGARALPSDLTFDALFVGERFGASYPFFEDAAARPLDPDAAGFDARNAWWCAEAALLVYVEDGGFIAGRLERVRPLRGFQFGTSRGDVLAPDTQFFVAWDDALVLVAFRGTETRLQDWMTDLNVAPVEAGGAGLVHRGFREALDEVWGDGDEDSLAALLGRLADERPDRPVWFTGHSLGGALAVLAADRFHRAHPGARAVVYTFGAPRVGTAAFRDALDVPVYRVVHATDVVAGLPMIGYQHCGQLHYLTREGELLAGDAAQRQIDASELRVVSNVRFFSQRALEGEWVALPRDVIDHSPLFYATHLWNASRPETGAMQD